jgi:hypothetical protein
MSGFEFLRCATDVHASDPAKEGGDPCEDAGCCPVESAQYHAPRQNEIAPVVISAVVSADNFGAVEQSRPKEASLGILTAAPPDLPSSWQFRFRTALAPRAPSFAS